MSQKVIRATGEEKQAYLKTKPVYPLFGWYTVDGVKCAVEDLSSWSKENPQYEVMAPDGHHFDVGEPLHSLLAFDMKDLKSRTSYAKVVKCGPECCDYNGKAS